MTTKTEPKTTALATMRAVELHRVLCDAKVFAGDDDTIPGICMVHIEIGGNKMLAVATDRFRLGASKTDLDENLGEAQFNLSLHDVNTIVKLAKTGRRDEHSRFVWVNRNDDGTVTFKFNDGASLDVTPQDTQFPKWRQLFPETGSQIPRDATAFTAEYLSSFAKVNGGDSQRVTMYSHDDIHGYRDKPEKPVAGKMYGTQRPTTFTIGENFVGLLMPVKLPDEAQHQWVKPEWLG
jgi:DNA polymerase III sliding clamp (beta) subunit (PCNA family)